MAESALRFVFLVLYVIVSSANITSAIRDYKNNRYFAGSLESMFALWLIFEIAKMVFMEEI